MIRTVINALIDREGGFVDHPNDPGGVTNRGVTGPTFIAWRRSIGGFVPETPEQLREQIKNLTRREARRIYQETFYQRYGIDRLPMLQVQEVVLDCAVLHGPRRAIRWLQKAVGAKSDGVIGPMTEDAVAGCPRFLTVAKITVLRIRFVGRIVRRRPHQAVFLDGWLSRATLFIEADSVVALRKK
jgi:type VI secretion system secreted protein VgrG